MLKRSLIVAVALISGYFKPLLVQAAESGLTVVPAIHELTLTQDASEVGYQLELANQSNRTIELEIVPSELPQGAIASLFPSVTLLQPSDESYNHLLPWLSIDQARLTLEGGARTAVAVRVANDPAMEPGSHYGVLHVRETAAAAQPSHLAIQSELQSLLVVRKIDGAQIDLRLHTLSVGPAWFALPTQVDLALRNQGNVHLIPRGRVELVDPFERVVAYGIINRESSIVLPQSERRYTVALRSTTPLLLPGRYRIVVDYRDGIDDAATRFEQSFVTLGSPLMIVFLSAGLGGLALLVRRIKRSRHG